MDSGFFNRADDLAMERENNYKRNESKDERIQMLKNALKLMLDAAYEADRHGELYESFDGDLLGRVEKALEEINKDE